jgi:Zn-dependent protease
VAHSEPKGARVIRLGLVLGIEVGIDRSWFAVLAPITWWLSRSDGPFQVLELAPSQRIVVSLLAAILFFVSVLIHELIYVLIVRRFGDRADGLTLYSLGGIARSESEVAIPIHSTWLLLVTPLVYVLVAGFCLACGAYGPSSAAWATLLMFLAGANAALAALNLLPVYPFDGGRVLHAIMWRYMGDRIRATRVSITIARILGLLFALYAVRQLMASDLSGHNPPPRFGLRQGWLCCPLWTDGDLPNFDYRSRIAAAVGGETRLP